MGSVTIRKAIAADVAADAYRNDLRETDVKPSACDIA